MVRAALKEVKKWLKNEKYYKKVQPKDKEEDKEVPV